MLISVAATAADEPGVMASRSRANWLNRMMSKIMRQNEGLSAFSGCAKSELPDVPDHSKAPASRDIPKVISEATVLTCKADRNFMKFAGLC